MDRANSSRIKGVILDYGEVLCYPPTAEEWARMASVFGVDPVSFRKLWDRNRLLYDRGDLLPEAYWSAVAKDAGTPLAPEQLPVLRQWDVEMWAHENPIMVEWLKQIHSSGTRPSGIRSSGIRTGLLSNMPHDMIQHVRKEFDWLECFDHQTFSAEVELIKPDPAIYEHSLRGVEVAASEALFVDDKEPNVQGARRVGIHAIQFQSVEQFGSDLEKLGFPILPSSAVSPVTGRS